MSRPLTREDAAVIRRNFVLHLMADAGLIDATAYAEARREELVLKTSWPEARSCYVEDGD